MQQYAYETKICDIDDLQKRLMQTWFDFEQNVRRGLSRLWFTSAWRNRLR